MILKRITIIAVLTASLFGLGQSTLAAKPKKGKKPPAFVETAVIKPTAYENKISSTGTLLSIPGTVVKPEIAGRITKIYFKSGQNVEKGTVLIEINPDIAKAKLESAQAELRLNKLNFERSQKLYNNKPRDISKSAFDEARANYDKAKALADGAKAVFDQTTIEAPFSGKLGISQVNEGDFVTIGQSIVNLQTMDPLKVDFSIPEGYLRKIAVGQKVVLKTDSYPQENFGGTVEAIESLINPNTRTLNVRANVPNKDGKLIPGGFAEVSLQISKKEDIMIPQTAIVYSATGNYVFKVVDGKAVKTTITIGKKDSKSAIVKSGLKTGDIIVISGQLKIQPGAPVIVVNGKSPEKN